MNAAHIHLLFNHFPVIGAVFGLAFFVVALIKRNELLIKASLWIFLVIAILTVPTYLSGDPAHEFIEKIPGLRHDIVEAHEELADKAFIAVMVLGALSLVGLIAYGRKRRPWKWYLPAMVVVSIIVMGLMAATANKGGEIRHPEINLQKAPDVEP